ncbi:MAG: amidohydrolase family protein [Gemmatimonadota bacterium]
MTDRRWVVATLLLLGCGGGDAPPPPADATMRAPSPAADAPVRALTHARLWTGTDAPLAEDGTVLIQGGRVAAAGPSSTVRVPADAEVTDLGGLWVVPGFINSHGHVGDVLGLEGGHYTEENLLRQLRLYAWYGVTTVVSLGGDAEEGVALRNGQDTPELDRSRLFVAGPVVEAETPDAAREVVAQLDHMDVDWVKIRVDDNLGTTRKMEPDVYTAVIDEAHARGLKVAAHIFYLEDARALLQAGADFIAHSVRDRTVDARFIEALSLSGACYSPTLMREVSTFIYESTPEFFADSFFLAQADTAVLRRLSDPARQAEVRANPAAQRYKQALETARLNLVVIAGAGLPVALGTDTGPAGRFQGYFEHREMELMSAAGMSPAAVLLAATRTAARCMGLPEVGTLEPGKWADLVVLEADPFQDIANTRRIHSVWIAGHRVR